MPDSQKNITNWAVGITTAPRREPTLERTLQSLVDAGWDQPQIFAEPETKIPAQFRSLPISQRNEVLGAFPNWYLALTELVLRHPRAEAFLLCQDDVLFSKELKRYLEYNLWPAKQVGVVSFSSSSHSQQNAQTGFVLEDGRDDNSGVLAYVFPNPSARSLLCDPIVLNHRDIGPADGFHHIESIVSNWCERNQLPYYAHSPVLAQQNGVSPTNPSKTTADNKKSDKEYDCDVVIPYCQSNLRWLTISVDSILNQAGVNCVIHLVADGFDGRSDPVRQYADHPNIRLYRNATTIGPYRTTNRILNRFETEFLAIQDSDDIAMPHRIAYSIETLQLQEAEMFGGAMRQFASWETCDQISKNRVNVTPVHKSGWHKWSICPEGVVINGTRLLTVNAFRRVGGFAPYMMSADCEFTTRCIRAGVKVAIDEEIIALRRVHSTSLSHGEAWGMGSKARDVCHEAMFESYEQMIPGFDPRQFGGLEQDLNDAHLTVRIN